MKKILPLCILLIMTVQTLPGQTSVHGRVCVHPDGRFLMYEDGTPFFWLGDTAWQMFHRLTVEESKIYLTDRAMKGFTVIQAVCLAEHGGLSSPNAEGEMAFTDTAFTVPNDRYFDHILRVVDMADSLGLVMGILPTWGDKFNLKWGPGPEIFDTEEKAYSYGLYVGNKFKDRDNIVWILGGDRPADSREHIIRAMAKGIAVGLCGKEDYSSCLMTYHPWGGTSCSKWFTDEPWLDFYMHPIGHPYDVPLWDRIGKDYHETKPVKPVLDGEPLYDEHAIDFKIENGVSTDYHTRRFFYHEVFSGACGHTFGSTGVWQCYNPAKFRKIEDVPTTPWRESLGRIASYQMGYGKELIMSRPFFSRIPDQSFIHKEYDHLDRITATRDTARTYAFVYTESGKPVEIDLTAIGRGPEVTVWWFDVRSGRAIPLGNHPRKSHAGFAPPTSGRGNDWVLVVDAPEAGYGIPGAGPAACLPFERDR